MPDKANKTKIITYETLEQQARASLAANNLEPLRAQLLKEHPANIAAVLDRLSHAERYQLFNPLPLEKKAKVLDELST